MSEPKPHQQYIARDITLTEWKIILRLRQVGAGVMTIAKDADTIQWSVGGFWEVPMSRAISASLPIEMTVT